VRLKSDLTENMLREALHCLASAWQPPRRQVVLLWKMTWFLATTSWTRQPVGHLENDKVPRLPYISLHTCLF